MPELEVNLVKNLDPLVLAERTGGVVGCEGDTPLSIYYGSGRIRWEALYVSTPFLEFPNGSGTTLSSDVAVLAESSVIIVRAGSSSGKVISLITFQEGDFSESQITARKAPALLRTAREMLVKKPSPRIRRSSI